MPLKKRSSQRKTPKPEIRLKAPATETVKIRRLRRLKRFVTFSPAFDVPHGTKTGRVKQPPPKKHKSYQEKAAAKEQQPTWSEKNPYDGNPKDLLAINKVPLHLVPDSMVVLASLGFAEGMLKYGQFNWRAKKVRMSVYLSALQRHMIKLNSGEMHDPQSLIMHVCNMLSCAAIIGDALLEGKLIFDRPPLADGLLKFMDDVPAQLKNLKEVFGHNNPVQYTEQNISSDGNPK